MVGLVHEILGWEQLHLLDGTEVDESMIQAVQAQWRAHFNAFWEEEFRSGFMDSTDLTASQWENIRERLVFVHDRLGAEEVVEHFENPSDPRRPTKIRRPVWNTWRSTARPITCWL